MQKKYSHYYILITSLAVLSFGALSFLYPGHLKRIERPFFDISSSLLNPKNKYSTSKILIVDVDTREAHCIGNSAGFKKKLAEVIGILKEAGAKAIGIALPIAPQDNKTLMELRDLNTSIRQLSRIKTLKNRITPVINNFENFTRTMSVDEALIKSFGSQGSVVLGYLSCMNKNKVVPCPEKTKAILLKNALPLNSGNKTLLEAIPTVSRIILPLEGNQFGSIVLGHLIALSNRQLPQRGHPPFVRYGEFILPSLPLGILMAYFGYQPGDISIEGNRIAIGNHTLTLVNGEYLTLHTVTRQAVPTFSFQEIYQSKKAPLSVENKIVLIGSTSRNNWDINRSRIPPASLYASIINQMLEGPHIGRPRQVIYVELGALLFFAGIAILLFPRLTQLFRISFALFLIITCLCLGALSLTYLGIWFRTSSIIMAVISIYIISTMRDLTTMRALQVEAIETNQLLGLSYQKQGLYELAFERFQLCPMNNETRDLMYELGLECEGKGRNSQAIEIYHYILTKGEFRDVGDRLAKLQSVERFPGFDTQGARKSEGPLSESFIRARRVVGRYQILEPIGKGTMGVVYKGLDPKINRYLAIKIIRFSDEFDEDLIVEIKDRFFREAEIAGKLSHPSIVTIYDVGEDRDLTYMAMEYLEGKDLDFYCKKSNLLSVLKVLDIITKVAEALDYAHTVGVIHRDIKPANIMLLKNGDVKVMDFGIAKAISSSRTKTGVILGTPNYMSPEQIMGHAMDSRSDIFSLGVLFFQLLTGHLPFRGENLSSLLYQIIQVKHPSVRELRPNVPKACEQLIDKALAKRPQDRFKSAREMVKYLNILSEKIREFQKK